MYITKRARDWASLIATLMVMPLLLSGCADGEASVTVNRNGSADLHLNLLVRSTCSSKSADPICRAA